MRHLQASRVVSLLAISTLALGSPTTRRDITHKPNRERADAVRQAFRRNWDGYSKYAFPHDSLKPISKSFDDDRNGWGASAVDALSTALVMSEDDIIQQIVDFVPTINFDNTTTEISLFETTIRYLGGLVSAHDLLVERSGKDGAASSSAAKAVLSQAERLATNLKVAFDTPSGVPDNGLFFDPAPRKSGSETNGIATIGTLVLEWTRLSDLTGNPVFGQLAQKGESYLLDPKPALGEPFPGLLGLNVNLTTGRFVDGVGGWGGGSDSFYEYLIKMYVYDPARFASYKDRWVLAADSTIKYLTSHPSTRPDITFVAMYNNTTRRYIGEHLACFAGGNFILGGLALNEQRYVDYGLKITAGCHDTYAQTATGIGPEVFRWQDANTSAVNNPGVPANDTGRADFYKRSGFWIPPDSDIGGASGYLLRPEVLESIYYAYRATGDRKYQDWAWDAFVAINKTCAQGVGYTSVSDVNAPGGGQPQDSQESFVFAETLKYAFLIHADDAPWQLTADAAQGYIFNTEAHPIKVAGRRG